MPDVTVSSDVDGFMTAANQAAMRTAIGLGSVNNTSDAAKPISTATQTAINAINDVNVFPSLLDVTGVKANDLVIIEGDKVYRATGPASFVAVMADPTSHTHTTSGIVDNSVTYAKIQDVSAASRLIGRGSGSGSGDPQEISLGSGLSMSGTVLSASGGGGGLGEPLVMPSTVMPALAIDVTKFVNTKSISADSTMTFSNATPTAGTRTELRVTVDSTARTLTIPSSYSYARNASITTILIPANATISLAFEYTGSRWEVYGDPIGSITRSVQLTAFDYGTNVATGDGAAYFVVPTSLNGMSLVSCSAYVIVAGTTGTTNVQLARIRSGSPVDMLSTVLSIDSTETGTDTAATAAVINASNDDVATHDRIRIDVDAVSTTAPRGLIVVLNFEVL
jgi:hypothetical protein